MPELLSQPDVCSALNDRDLLRRFVQDADENAFAEIVRRHQGLVLGVCRRVLGNDADIDDVFQATFITLARRPRSVQKTGSLGSWLYTVAWRTSWRLVKKRRKHPVESLSNHPLSEPEDPLDRIASAQDCLVLDEELNRLPARYREVLVMTYFSSQTSQQIADQLSISKGTVDGRIRQARNMLRIRLARRGVAIGVLAVAAGLGTGSKAMASATLLESTIQLGAQTLSGSVPGTTDLAHLEPFIQAETAMITTKTILTSLFCATAVVGIIGMNGLRQEGDIVPVDSGAQPPAKIDGVVAEVVDEVGVPSPLVELAAAGAAEAAYEAQDEQSLTIYHLDYLKADSTLATLEKLFSSGAVTLKADARTNSIIAQANAEQHKRIEQVLEKLRETAQPDEPSLANIELATSEGPTFKLYPQDVRPAEKWLYEMLEQPVTLDFPGENPLSEILEHLATTLSTQHGQSNGTEFTFTVRPDHKQLELESITSLEDVLIKDIYFKDIALESALTLLFEQTDPELTYQIRNEVMVVTTREKAETSLVTRVYEVGHLLNLEFEQNVYPPGYTGEVSGGGMGGGGGLFSVQMGGMGQGGGTPSKAGTRKKTRKAEQPEEESLVYVEEESLASLIIEMTSPPCLWMDVDGDGGAIQQVGDTLVVRQTQAGHREIIRLLNLLTESGKKQTAAP